MDNYTEFIKDIKKVQEPRKHKVKNSYGVYDAYKWIRKNNWLNIGRPLKENEFYSIIRKINELLAKEISEGNDIILPCRMGRLEVRKTIIEPKFVNNKFASNLPVDWQATLKLWYEDEEAREHRHLIYKEDKEVFRVVYNLKDANYNNKGFYKFYINRSIKLDLKECIKNDNLDAFLKYNDYGKLYKYKTNSR